jgi:iron-sulfur cluster assembly protein
MQSKRLWPIIEASTNNMISATQTAASKIVGNLHKRGSGVGIRLGTKTTGCSGLAYVLEYVDTTRPTDIVYDADGFKIVVDPKDVIVLSGLVIDYVRQGLNEGFAFSNPNERDRCGCGESFRVK